jgi:hypothetical protein
MSTGPTHNTNPEPVKLIALPGAVALRPELWLALGVASYNHALLTKKPLRVLVFGEVVANELNQARTKALDEGLAALADASQMSPSSLQATVRISNQLLAPIGVEVTVIGDEHTRRYMLLEFKGHEWAQITGEHPLRILPQHDYPPSGFEDTTTGDPRKLRAGPPTMPGTEPGAEAHRKAQGEAEQPDTVTKRA